MVLRRGMSEKEQGIAAFVVERGTPGLIAGPPDDKMGLRGVHTGPVRLVACLVPAENRLPLPAEPSAFTRALWSLNQTRPALGGLPLSPSRLPTTALVVAMPTPCAPPLEV